MNAITASTITSRAYTAGLATAVEVFRAIAQTPMPLDDAISDEVEKSNTEEE